MGSALTDLILDVRRGVRFREEDIAALALLTAAFFVASLVHVRVGPTSVHLLLNGLVGVVLGWRAALAIPAGLFLQAALIGHGGFTTLGVNSCVMVLPALLAWLVFDGLRRLPWVKRPWFRTTLVTASVLVWTLSLVYSLALLSSNRLGPLPALDTTRADQLTFHPATLSAALLLAVAAASLERRLGNAPEFALGLLVGEVAVLATAFLNFAVLLWGGGEDWHTLALLTFVAHLPIAVIEGIVLGFVVGFLARVKPELLSCIGQENTIYGSAPLPCPAPAGPNALTALNGRSAHVSSIPPAAPPCPAPEFAGNALPVQPSQGSSP
jgi:ABC-type Co2+ transport system permease subunit